jgi:hypothetical protein
VDYDNVDFKDYECKFRLEKQKQKEEREPEPTYTNHFATLCETLDSLNPMKLLEHERIEMCDYARMLIKHYNEEKVCSFLKCSIIYGSLFKKEKINPLQLSLLLLIFNFEQLV